jgi:hypothetical protein
MSCSGGHLGFPIGIANRNLIKDIPMIIHLQFGFSQFISFREEDLWNFIQSEHIIGPGRHVEYPTGTKNRNFVEDHPRNISAKFGFNWPSGFGEEAWNVKKFTDDGRQVMAIVHMDLWYRWTKKGLDFTIVGSLPLFYVVNKNNKELPAYRNNTLGSTPTSTAITGVPTNTHSVLVAIIYSCTVEVWACLTSPTWF